MAFSASADSDRGNPLRLLEFSGNRRVRLIMQTEVAECGLACLAMIANYHGYKTDLLSLRQRFSTNHSGINLQQMVDLAGGLNIASRPLKCPLESVGKLNLPCVLHWDLHHFVVLTDVTKRQVSINDPAVGKRTLSLSEFSDHYTGIALELTPTADFKKQEESYSMSFRQLWSRITGLGTGLSALVILSFIIQLFALAMPYYMQWIVDEVLLSQDKPLLIVLAFGFGLLVLLNVFTSAIRSYLILRLSSMMNMQMGVNLLSHLLKLPMRYFEKRHIGDLVSRFGSLGAIRQQLTTGFASALVDGLMSIAMLAVMFNYSIKLTLVVLVSIGFYTLLRVGLYQPLQRATEESIQAQAKEESNFLENIRGIQTIKLFSSEPLRLSLWQGRYSAVINADIRLGKLSITYDTARSLLFGVENIVVIYLAATTVMSGYLTVGMVLAFVAYKNQLTERAADFIEQMVMFRMMRLHLDRISDIALEEIEPNREQHIQLNEINGHLELEKVSFRYDENKPWVIKDLDLTIRAGESLVISGPSGCGKTTLMKIMLGLLEPDEGRILLDGRDITHIGTVRYRQQIAAVMQDDTLLAGSILDNLCFFNPEPDLLKAQHCAQMAAIDSEINCMSMGYNSLVGDMGNEFSGGQVQRLLLARALYQNPKILFMDEATSHLDARSESHITEQISQLPMTRVMIAHRAETTSQASRLVVMYEGKICEPGLQSPYYGS